MIIRTLDFETTGFPAEGKPSALIQVGWTDVVYDDLNKVVESVGTPVNHFVNPFRTRPGLEIDIGAMATHHITKDDLAEAPSIEPILLQLVKGADVFACHNKEHDGYYFNPTAPFICTLKAARRVWPEMESHSNQYLRYALKLPVDRHLAEPPHWAGPDSYVTAHLVAALLNEGATISDLIEFSYAPTIMKIIKFGKHKGAEFKDIPLDYLEYLMRERKADRSKPDRDLEATLEYWIELRGGKT